MAKYLKEVLKGVKSSTKVTNDLGGYKPKAGDEEDFAKKHEIEKHADRVGNGDDVYKGTTKHVLANTKEKNHGYKKPEDAKVNEEQIDEAGMPASVIKSKQHRANMTDKQFADSHKDKSDADLRSMAWRHGHGKPGTPGHNHYVNRRNKGLKEEEQIDELSTDLLHRAAHKAAKKAMSDVQGRSGPIFKKRAAQANKFRAKGMEQEKKEKATKSVKEELLDEISAKTALKTAVKRQAGAHNAAIERGDVLSDKEQHKVDRSQALIKNKYGQRGANIVDKAVGKKIGYQGEETEQIDELSKKTLGNYAHAGVRDIASRQYALGKGDKSNTGKLMNRRKGVDKAISKLSKEEVEQVDELSKTTLGNYIKSASADVGHKKADAAYSNMSGNDKLANRHTDKARKRLAGIYTAANKLTKESETPITFPNKQSNNAVGQNV